MDSPTKPVMQAHDPNDDPFAALCADYDESHAIKPPTEFGSGAIDKDSLDSPESREESTGEKETHDTTVDDKEKSPRREDGDAPKEEKKEE